MANRAYLWATDGAEPGCLERPDFASGSVPCFDSRWSIPVAWFLFFTPAAVRRRAGSAGGEGVPGVALVGERAAGLRRFEQRRRLLSGRFPLGEVDYDAFLARIGKWQGRLLVVDPAEILREGAGTDEVTAERFVSALAALERLDEDAFFDHLRLYLGEFRAASAGSLEANVVGCALEG